MKDENVRYIDDEVSKIHFTLRLDRKVYRFVDSLSKKHNVPFSKVLNTTLMIGILHNKTLDDDLKRISDRIIEENKYEDETLELRLMLRKYYLVENFEALARKIRNNVTMSDEDKLLILNKMIDRIVSMFGKESYQYKAVKNWVDLNVRNKKS
jgi:hypothetical protein